MKTEKFMKTEKRIVVFGTFVTALKDVQQVVKEFFPDYDVSTCRYDHQINDVFYGHLEQKVESAQGTGLTDVKRKKRRKNKTLPVFAIYDGNIRHAYANSFEGNITRKAPEINDICFEMGVYLLKYDHYSGQLQDQHKKDLSEKLDKFKEKLG